MKPPATVPDAALVEATARIVAAHLGANPVAADDVAPLIASVYRALSALGTNVPPSGREPVVPIEQSVTPDYIVCLEDGKRLKMLKRYLRVRYGLTPEEYRRKWGLPPDYPIVAPGYAQKRSAFAKAIGLGTARTSGGRKGRRAA